MAFEIAPLTDTPAIRACLRDLLVDVVDHGGAVHFMAPLSPAEAEAFWESALQAMAQGERKIFGAFDKALETAERVLAEASPLRL